MKALKIIIMSVLIFLSGQLLNSEKASAQVSVSFQAFYDDLSPYGRWVDYPNYGYVWIPSAGPGFIPYSTSGHWVMTDFGWTWVSDFNWGWAPFHYGRWFYDDFYGWLWVPGHEWGPAWVCWRHAHGYYGWTPIAPSISLSVAFGPRWHVPHDRWIFVNERYINHPHWNNYLAPRNQNVTIIKNSTVINNTYEDNSHHVTYVSGPRRDEVQRVTGSPVKSVALRESNKPEQSLSNNELKIYRPAVQKADAGGSRPVPKNVTPLKEVKSPKNNSADEAAPKTSAPAKDQDQRQNVNRGNKTENPDGVKPAPSQDVKKPSDENVNKPTDVNRDQRAAKPENTIDKTRQRQMDRPKKAIPVQRERSRNDKHDERH